MALSVDSVSDVAASKHSTVTIPWHQDRDALKFFAMLFLTGSFFFVELIGGFMLGSLSLVADAMHMLSDLIALVIGFYTVRVRRQRACVRRH